MRTSANWAKGTAPVALLALGVMTLGSGTAYAGTSGDYSVGGGNQLNLPITLPIDISGNAVAVAGDANAASRGGAVVDRRGGGAGQGGPGRTSGTSSVLGGNQVDAPITAPISACGNAIAVLGSSRAGCTGGAAVHERHGHGRGHGAGHNVTSGRSSVLGGNQVVAPITAPLSACGNAVAIFGNATAGCRGGAVVHRHHGHGHGAGHNVTSGRSSVLGGNQVVAPIDAPIDICGTSVGVFGGAFSACRGGASVVDGPRRREPLPRPGRIDRPGSAQGGGGRSSSGTRSYATSGAGGAGGVGGAGAATTTTGTTMTPVAPPRLSQSPGSPFGPGAGGNVTSGRSSVLGGNQVVAPINAPIDVCGNAVSALGRAFAACKGGARVAGWSGGAGHNVTSGRSSVLGGNQVVIPITTPVNVCGNAVAVLGDAAAGCLGGAGRGGSAARGRAGRTAMAASGDSGVAKTAGLPVVGGLVGGAGGQSSPLDGVRRGLGLARLPDLPGLPGAASLPGVPTSPRTGAVPAHPRGVTSKAGKHARTDEHVVRQAADAAKAKGTAESGPATSDVARHRSARPETHPSKVERQVGAVTDAVPVGGLDLMSAEEPMGTQRPLSGKASGFLALVLGAMATASALMFATTRRPRPRRR